MMQELNYIRCGDYYIPDIRLPDENRPIVGGDVCTETIYIFLDHKTRELRIALRRGKTASNLHLTFCQKRL